MKHTTMIEDALSLMKEHGYKYTKKREFLLRYLIFANRYVSAKDVYETMEKEFSGISYDTVYRNLHDFAAIDLVEETELNGEMKFRSHCNHGHMGHHHHFICTVCGKTKEIHMCPMNFFAEQLAGCQIEGHKFEIYGRCEDCSQK